jgi:hypothetical protein
MVVKEGSAGMGLCLDIVERKVLRCFQEDEYPLLASAVAERTGYENEEVMMAFSSLAEKGLLDIEDRTAGELSFMGRNYDLFDDESIDNLSLRRETEIVLDSLKHHPENTVSRKKLETMDGLTPEEIDRAIDALEDLGYPIHSRVRP